MTFLKAKIMKGLSVSHSALYKWQGTGHLMKEHPDQSHPFLSQSPPVPRSPNLNAATLKSELQKKLNTAELGPMQNPSKTPQTKAGGARGMYVEQCIQPAAVEALRIKQGNQSKLLQVMVGVSAVTCANNFFKTKKNSK